MKNIIITYFTDPVCNWCWAMEPVFRALETRYPGLYELRHVMGGMVGSIADFREELGARDASITEINRAMGQHWAEGAQRHRMPIRSEGLRLFDEEYGSSHPVCIAGKAAQLAAPGKADKYLRLLRLHTMARAAQTNRLPVQVEVAREAGIDLSAFTQAMADGSAERAFHADLGLTRGFGVQVFPTFQVKNRRARQVVMRGYNSRQDFENVFRELGEDTEALAAPPEQEILDWLLEQNGPLAEEEVVQAFDFSSRAAADAWMEGLVSSGSYYREPVGESFLLHRKAR